MTFRPIQYLGSKMRLVDQIEDLVKDLSEGPVFCDLFAGSGVVSNKLARNYQVKACDIQEYSKVITTALFTKVSIASEEVSDFLNACIHSTYHQTLLEQLKELIDYERQCLDLAESGSPDQLVDFSNNCSLYIHHFDHDKVDRESDVYSLKSAYLGQKNQSDANITLIYGGVYFSFAQAAWIDSVLKQIRTSDLIDEKKNFYKAVLLSTASEIVNTVGKQFAQPMKLLDRNHKPKKLLIERTIRDKRYTCSNFFHRYASEYSNSTALISENAHQFYRMDFGEFLERNEQDIHCFYADPPYTIDHYSRFYHVLETIARGDLPNLASMKKKGVSVIMNGMYRDDRHQSPFCIPSQAPAAFEKLVEGCAKHGAPLIISYSPYDESNDDRPRLLKTEELLSISNKHYGKVEIISIENHAHRKLHSTNKNIDTIQSGEMFVVCSSTLN